MNARRRRVNGDVREQRPSVLHTAFSVLLFNCSVRESLTAFLGDVREQRPSVLHTAFSALLFNCSVRESLAAFLGDVREQHPSVLHTAFSVLLFNCFVMESLTAFLGGRAGATSLRASYRFLCLVIELLCAGKPDGFFGGTCRSSVPPVKAHKKTHPDSHPSASSN